jgi:hypothetical protein
MESFGIPNVFKHKINRHGEVRVLIDSYLWTVWVFRDTDTEAAHIEIAKKRFANLINKASRRINDY